MATEVVTPPGEADYWSDKLAGFTFDEAVETYAHWLDRLRMAERDLEEAARKHGEANKQAIGTRKLVARVRARVLELSREQPSSATNR